MCTVFKVGHDRSLDQTVFIREKFDRTVHYFFQAHRKLKGGDRIELLTSYQASYEDMRERKGYGLKNLHRGDKTDQDLSSSLRRNFEVRIIVERTIEKLGPRELFDTLKFVVDIWAYLIKRVAPSMSRQRNDVLRSELSSFQWKAVFRMLWLAKLFRKRAAAIEQDFSSTTGYETLTKDLVESSRILIAEIAVPKELDDLSYLLRGGMFDPSGQCVKKTITEEFTEEILYGIRDKIRSPFSGSMWCRMGKSVLEKLVLAVAKVKLSNVRENWSTKEEKELGDAFLEIATGAATELSQVSSSGNNVLTSSFCNCSTFNL